MNQSNKRDKKEEANQLSIKNYILPSTVDLSQSTKEEHTNSDTPRSRPTKRKIPPSPSSSKKQEESERKKPFNCQTLPVIMAELPEKNMPLTLEAVECLLQPLDACINEVLSYQKEMKDTIGKASTLKDEKQRVTKVKEINAKLCKRPNSLENKMLESYIVMTVVKEDTWETDEVRRNKLFEILSNTVLGRTLEERLDTAKIVYIKNSTRVGRFRKMYNHPICLEFLYKVDADYVINNRSYLPEGVYIDRQGN